MSGIIGQVGARSGVIGSTTDGTQLDYEEGDWTAAMSDGSTSLSMTSTAGYYTKIGNMVHISGYFATDNLNGLTSEAIRITGLPFEIASTNASFSIGATRCTYINITAGESVVVLGRVGQSYIELHVWGETTGTSAMTATEWSADGTIMIGFSYRAA